MANKGSVVFVTTKKSKGTYIVNQNLTITDEIQIGNTKKKTKKRRVLRYVESLDSIFVDEQKSFLGDEKIDSSPVFIVKGKREVKEDQINLISFLRKHPDNVANGGKDFKEFDETKEDKLEVEQFTKTANIVAKVMEADDNLVRSIAVWFLGIKNIKTDPVKIKKALYVKCHTSFKFALEVEKFMNDKGNEEKLLVTLALTKNVIRIKDGKKITWIDSEESLFNGSQSKDLIAEFSTWLKSDQEGRETLKLIADKM